MIRAYFQLANDCGRNPLEMELKAKKDELTALKGKERLCRTMSKMFREQSTDARKALRKLEQEQLRLLVELHNKQKSLSDKRMAPRSTNTVVKKSGPRQKHQDLTVPFSPIAHRTRSADSRSIKNL